MNQEQSPKRKYASSLRRQQRELTIDAIMAAVEELILHGEIHNFTVQEVARLSGVSYATIYRHYPSREALIRGFRDWSLDSGRADPAPYVDKLEDLPKWVEQTYPALLQKYLPQIKALYAAMAALQIADVHTKSRERDVWIERLVNEAAPDAPAHVRRASSILIRHVVSLSAWLEFHTRYGLDIPEVTSVVIETIYAQMAHLQSASRRITHQ